MLQASRALIFLTSECMVRALIFRNHIKSRALCSDTNLNSYCPELKIVLPLSCAHCTQMNIVRISYHAQLLRYCAYFRHTLHHNTGYFIQVKKTFISSLLQFPAIFLRFFKVPNFSLTSSKLSFFYAIMKVL